MKSEYSAICQLPRSRTGTRVKWLADASVFTITAAGLAAYLAVVLVISGIEIISLHYGAPWVIYQESNTTKNATEWQIVYFNFVTILTIGYGDFTPRGFGQFLAVLEAIIGTGVVGLTIAALTAKFMSPPRNSVVFSRYGYYCTEDQRFLIIFVNTTKNLLINAEMSSYFKLGGNWGVVPSIRSPFITQAVQTFFLDKISPKELAAKLRDGDVFRFSIEGRIGDTVFSTAIQYRPEEIIVLSNRRKLTDYKGFWDLNFRSNELAQMFHYRPPDAPTLPEYLDGQAERAD